MKASSSLSNNATWQSVSDTPFPLCHLFKIHIDTIDSWFCCRCSSLSQETARNRFYWRTGLKRCPQTFFCNFELPLFAKIRFNPFDSVPLATLLFAILWHHKRRTVDQYWQPRSTAGLPNPWPAGHIWPQGFFACLISSWKGLLSIFWQIKRSKPKSSFVGFPEISSDLRRRPFFWSSSTFWDRFPHRRSQGGGPGGPGPPPIKITLTTKSYDNIAWRCLVAVFFSNYAHNSN